MQWDGHRRFVRMVEEGPSDEGTPEQVPKAARKTVWEQSLGAEGTVVLYRGPSGGNKGPVCLGGVSEGTVVRAQVQGKG